MCVRACAPYLLIVLWWYSLQFPALAALKHLAWDSVSRQEQIANEGGIDLVFAVARTLPNSAPVLVEAFCLLRNLGWHPELRTRILGDDPVDLIVTALSVGMQPKSVLC